MAPRPRDRGPGSSCPGASGREEDKASYFEDGRIPASLVEQLFDAARFLHLAGPWQTALDDDLLRLDIPQLGLAGASISVLGAAGLERGFVIFPSYWAFEAFLDATAGSEVEGAQTHGPG